MKRKVLLDEAGIKDLIRVLLNLFKMQIEHKTDYISAQYIQFPKVPPILSECIVMDLVQRGAILKNEKVQNISKGGKADVIITTNDKELKIEVKATGEAAFQNFTEKDINSDYIVWLHFDIFF